MALHIRVHCFANPDRGLAGNVCHVHVDEHAPTVPVDSRETHCHVQPQDSGGHEVSCFAGRRPIRICGHGLLAAAATLMRMTGRESASLAMNGMLIEAGRDAGADLFWITFPTIRIDRGNHGQDGRTRTAVAALLQQPIADLATAGDEDGYLVVRLPDGFDLTVLSPPGQALAHLTRRSLIATTLLDRAGAIGLRYFAPQHGVEEDAATGSAMRVLAAYWADRFDQLTATQFSPAGGELFSTISGARTRIGGRVVTGD